MSPKRRSLVSFAAPAAALAIALASLQCGLLVSPGDYSSGGGDPLDASVDTSVPTDALNEPENVVLPDGNVVPSSIGTIALMAGERTPTSAEDDPAWSADAWSGVLGADGRVVTWRIEKSAPIVGSFGTAGLIGTTWIMLNTGVGLGGTRGTTLQSTSWGPGIVGDWRAARATGAPGGLDDLTRLFFGTRLLYIGGTRTTAVDGGTTTAFAREVHVAAVDVTKNELGPSSDTGDQLVTARARPGLLQTGASLYVVGGRTGAGITASVERATVDVAAGTIEAFAEASPLMNAGAEHKVFLPSVVAEGGYLFVAGGRTTTANVPTDVVLVSRIGADGTLGPFSNVTNLPKPLRDFAFVGFKGRLYVMGGIGTKDRSDEVFSAAVAADGTLGAWDNSHAKLPAARADFVALAY